MKTLSKMLAVGALLAATVVAQRPFGTTSSTPPDPATIVARKVDHLTKLLGLSTTQAGQATTYFTEALTAITPLETTLHTDRQSLQTAIKANDAANIETLSTNVGSLNGQVLALQSKADAQFYAILSPGQQTTLNASRGHGEGYGHGPGH
jgi:hypothetical protein